MMKENDQTNLTAITITLSPVGTIFPYIFSGTDLPPGWLLCDGSAFDQTQYPELYRLLENKNILPDLRGYFPRGLDPAGRVDPDGPRRAVQSAQQDAYAQHSHLYTRFVYFWTEFRGGNTFVTPGKSHNNVDSFSTTEATTEVGAPETRPKNIAVNYLIFAGIPAHTTTPSPKAG